MANKSPFLAYSEAKKSRAFFIERLKTKFAVSIERLMDYRECKRKDLADRLEVSRPYVSKILRGDANVTIETIGSLAHSLDADVSISFTPKEYKSANWFIVMGSDFRAPASSYLNPCNDPVTADLESSLDDNLDTTPLWFDRASDTRKVVNG